MASGPLQQESGAVAELKSFFAAAFWSQMFAAPSSYAHARMTAYVPVTRWCIFPVAGMWVQTSLLRGHHTSSAATKIGVICGIFFLHFWCK